MDKQFKKKIKGRLKTWVYYFLRDQFLLTFNYSNRLTRRYENKPELMFRICIILNFSINMIKFIIFKIFT